MPAYSNASLIFSFEGALDMRNVLEESLLSETAQTGTSDVVVDKVAAPVINHSLVSIFLQTLAPHLTGLLPQFTVPPSPPIMPSTIATTMPSLLLARPDDLMEDFLQHFTSGFH